MKPYDPHKPLIFSHIPKTAGSSVRQVFRSWFKDNLLEHYRKGALPEKHDLDAPPLPQRPVVLFGHFNHQCGFGITQYYPQVDQVITLLRDPWERAVSGYFFRTRSPAARANFPKVAAMSLEEYLAGWPFEDPDFGPPISNFLPQPCDMSNFREILDTQFVEIGLTEYLPRSMTRIAAALEMPFDAAQLPHVNAAARSRPVPDHLKAAFIARSPLDYAIYNHVKERHV